LKPNWNTYILEHELFLNIAVKTLNHKIPSPLPSCASATVNVNVIIKCLVLVKINGNSPRKLLNRINEKNIKVLPLTLSPSSVLNSLWSFVRPPLWSSGQCSWLQIRRPGFDSRPYQKKKEWVWNGVHSAS
jgi:hypothetical protein